MTTYPRDLILRPGRRVCRVGDWVEPELVSGTPRGSGSWVCGTLVEIEDETALVEILGARDPVVWAYPIDRLEVAHDQEKMTNEQYLWALLTIQERITNGLRLVAFDSTAIGNKYTYCSWGFHEDRYAPKDIPGMWPIGMPRRQNRHHCPLDAEPERGRSGCFYRCLAFQKRQELNRELAIFLYTDALVMARDELGS